MTDALVTTMDALAALATSAVQETAANPASPSIFGPLPGGLAGLWMKAFGHLHPVLVHMPLGLVMVALVVELWATVRGRPTSPAAATMLGFAAFGGLAAMVSGWWNAAGNPDPDELVDLHRWVGVGSSWALVITAILCALARNPERARTRRAGRLALLVSAGGVAFSGHLGGAMVWGPDYTTGTLIQAVKATVSGELPGTEEPESSAGRSQRKPPTQASGGAAPATGATPASAPGATPAPAAAAGASLAERAHALMVARCAECHMGGKKKGGLRMEAREQMVRKDDKGVWIVKDGDPDGSELIVRVTLPPGDDDHMPPEGAPLTSAEVELLREWIRAGAPWPGSNAAPSAPATPAAPATSPAPTPPPAPAAPHSLPPPPDAARVATVAARGAVVLPVAQGSTELEINASQAKPAWTDADMALLAGLESNVVTLSLARSAVTGAGMASLGGFPRLRTLRLDGTAADDTAMKALAGLPELERLNLVQTRVTDAGLRELSACRGLRKLYLGGSAVTPEGVAALRAGRPDVVVVTQEVAAPAAGK